MKVLDNLGVYGWKERDENHLLASLLTGDPLLLIGNHGSAKTLVANKIAEALGKAFLVYDASKAMFEDILGYPNVEKLRQGIVEYVPSKVTVWDKEIILIDELNRAVPELQSKWLEIIRSRKIMGFETRVRWVWAAMNPSSYAGAQALDAALVGRFALFVRPPDVLQMSEEDRIRVTTHINGEDAPGIVEWLPENSKTVRKETVIGTGAKMREMLALAARHFVRLRSEMPALSEFLARFADLLMRESGGKIQLDGRRLGFIHRSLLAARAVELAKAETLGGEVGSFVESARYVVQSSIPIGLGEEGVNHEEGLHQVDICFDLLSRYFEENSEIAKVNLVYELFTTRNLMRKAEILLREDLGEFALSKAWTDLMAGETDVSLLAYTALQVEARRPGTVPRELLESLSAKIGGGHLSSRYVPDLEGEAVEHIEEIEKLLVQESDLAKLIAYERVARLVESGRVTPARIEEAGRGIRQDIETFEQLIVKGGESHEDIQTVA